MCPVCVTTIALVAAGATSTGGIATLVVRRLRGKKNRNKERDREHRKEYPQ